MTILLRIDGTAIDVAPAEVCSLQPLPAALLPVGVLDGTNITFTGGRPDIGVQGTVAAVNANLGTPAVALTRIDGLTIAVAAAEVCSLQPLPAALLPVGVPDGTNISFTGGQPTIGVQGTVAATAALLPVTPPGAIVSGEFTFRPGAVDNVPLGIFGTWAGLVAATAALAAAGVPFVVNVDFSTLGASFLVPSSANFGGNCTLRGVGTPGTFTLQIQDPAALLTGVSVIDALWLEGVGASAFSPFILPVGASQLVLRNGAILFNTNVNAPIIAVNAASQLVLLLETGSGLQFGGGAAPVDVSGAGSALAITVGPGCAINDNKLSGDGAGQLVFVKEAPSSRLPGALAAYVGYLNGGLGSNAVFTPLYSLFRAQFAAAALPLIAGVYFLPLGGTALATGVDTPYIEGPDAGGRLRLLTGVWLFARADGTDGAAPQTIELLVNGVVVATVGAGFLMTLRTNPLFLSPASPIMLQMGGVVSVRITYGGAGITATPGDIFAVMEAA